VPEPDLDKARFCWRCGHPVVVREAQFCKDCGAPLAGGRFFARDLGFNPVIAALLSVIPGLGHVYKGSPGRGAIWFFVVMLSYGVNPSLGLILQLVCAANAALKGAIQEDAFARSRHRRHRHSNSRFPYPGEDR
jgi:hypothetical protein